MALRAGRYIPPCTPTACKLYAGQRCFAPHDQRNNPKPYVYWVAAFLRHPHAAHACVLPGLNTPRLTPQPGTLHSSRPAGCTDLELRMYAIHGPSTPSTAEDDDAAAVGVAAPRSRHDVLTPMGSVRRSGQDRAVMVRFGARGRLLGCLAAGKSLELFR